MSIGRILVPTDFGPSAGAAWAYAQMLAQKFGSRLYLAHVLAPAPFVSDPFGEERLTLQVADLLRESETEVRRALDRVPVRGSLASRVVRSTRVGKPVDEILKLVRELGIDLVVMGTHGRGPVGHVLLGSVAERVVRRCPVPVLTIHGGRRARKSVRRSRARA